MGASSTKPTQERKRWAAVSASANAEAEYKLVTQDPAKAYAYLCLCRMPSDSSGGGDEWSDADSDLDSENEEAQGVGGSDDEDGSRDGAGGKQDNTEGTRCRRGKNCICLQDAKDHPDHPWVITYAGFRKFLAQRIHIELRDPGNFQLDTWNDHASQGALEVLQNLILDFAEAESNWREQWSVCEAMVVFLLSEFDRIVMMDDVEAINGALLLVGRAFLSVLARLEREKVLDETSEVRNLGRVMAWYLKFASEAREQSFLEEHSDGDEADEDEDEDDEKKKAEQFEFTQHRFDDYIIAYANKFALPLLGPENIDDIAAECDGTVELPVAAKYEGDPWGFRAALYRYEKWHGVAGKSGKPTIGGDKLDLTTWTSAERKAASYGGRDPLGKKEIDAIKKGLVMQLG